MDQVFTLTVTVQPIVIQVQPIQISFSIEDNGSLQPETLDWKSQNPWRFFPKKGEAPKKPERRKRKQDPALRGFAKAKAIGKRKIRTLLKTTNWSYKNIAREVNRLCKPFQTTNKSVGHMAWRMWNLNQARMPVWRHSDRPSGAQFKMKKRLKPLTKRSKNHE